MKKEYQKGRGAQINTPNPYEKHRYENVPELEDEAPESGLRPTNYQKVYPRSIVNKVKSPDIPSNWSINPYQGCEHGCVYCYARNTHPYWGYSAGTEFEENILIKHDAPALLAKKLQHPKWKAAPIMLSGNTDCYQPAETKFGLTRQLLEVFWKYRHPVGIITKNKLILRDLDLLRQLAGEQLVHVAISITTLDEDLRRRLEPRTSTATDRIETVRRLSVHGIPVTVMLAPVIPGLTDSEIFPISKAVSDAGARNIHYTMVRLNGDVSALFADWLERTYPDRKEKVLNLIRETHGGQLKDSRFGKRMSGEGEVARMISEQFRVARQKYFTGREVPPYNLDLHQRHKSDQLALFD